MSLLQLKFTLSCRKLYYRIGSRAVVGVQHSQFETTFMTSANPSTTLKGSEGENDEKTFSPENIDWTLKTYLNFLID
jgi:hypothetical protein